MVRTAAPRGREGGGRHEAQAVTRGGVRGAGDEDEGGDSERGADLGRGVEQSGGGSSVAVVDS